MPTDDTSPFDAEGFDLLPSTNLVAQPRASDPRYVAPELRLMRDQLEHEYHFAVEVAEPEVIADLRCLLRATRTAIELAVLEWWDAVAEHGHMAGRVRPRWGKWVKYGESWLVSDGEVGEDVTVVSKAGKRRTVHIVGRVAVSTRLIERQTSIDWGLTTQVLFVPGDPETGHCEVDFADADRTIAEDDGYNVWSYTRESRHEALVQGPSRFDLDLCQATLDYIADRLDEVAASPSG